MRVIHFARTDGTGHVEPWCGVWGSTATDWTDVAAAVTCVGCRAAMRDGARDGLLVEEGSPSRSATARIRAPGRFSFALPCLAAALVAFAGAWSLLAVSRVLPPAGSRATTVFLWTTVVILVLSGAVFAALAGTQLGLRLHRERRQVRATPPAAAPQARP
jgi:hypothetical protein